ncbi:MAG: phosphoribosylamine--glycine ligase, partial [Gammaproteobacteria bacterium]
VDRFAEAGLRAFGPSAAAARLEGSKAFTKAFLARHRIPTARYRVCTGLAEACAYIDECGAPIVIKADGLAAGKGVVVAGDVNEAKEAARDMLSGSAFGPAGERIVIEEFLAGEEASFIAVVGDGVVLPLASSQDHKALGDGDTGPNTGGMGAYSPAPVVDAAMHERIMREIAEPTVRALEADGLPYVGFLYAGIMVGTDGMPRVLEYNCRGGDPETQPILMRLRSDLTVLCEAAIDGRLGEHTASWDERFALGVVMAAGGYPAAYAKGETIEGLDAGAPDTKVFHAGTRPGGGGVVTDGGRVLCVCALGVTASDAQSRAYARVNDIRWPNAYYRTDIGYRAVARE